MPLEHKCHICSKVLGRSTILRDHIRSHQGKHAFKCTVCGRAFVRNSDRKDHEKTHTTNYTYVCRRKNEDDSTSGCDAKFRCKNDLIRHLKRKHNAKCFSKHPMQHLISKETPNVDTDPSDSSVDTVRAIPKPAAAQAAQRGALLSVTSETSPFGSCHIINYRMAGSNSMEAYRHRAKPPKSPPRIETRAMTSVSLRKPGSSKARPESCQDNDNLARSSLSLQNSSLNNIEQRRNNASTYLCSFCPRRFSQPYHTQHHEEVHGETWTPECSFCHKAFTYNHDLIKHERLHRDKMFMCGGKLGSGQSWGCGRRYERAEWLDRHFASETGRVCVKSLKIAQNVMTGNDAQSVTTSTLRQDMEGQGHSRARSDRPTELSYREYDDVLQFEHISFEDGTIVTATALFVEEDVAEHIII